MRAPFTQLYVHCVWATWDRLPLLTAQIEQAVYAAILDKSRELKCEPIAIGGMPEHVHLLVRLPTTLAVADLVKEIKGASSHLVTHRLTPGEFFKWQGAYGAFTVSPDHIEDVRTYVVRQKEHHAANDTVAVWEQTTIEDAKVPGG
jgi:REP element-mobilizing transposase RayT